MQEGVNPISAFGRACLKVDEYLLSAKPSHLVRGMCGEAHIIEFKTALDLYRAKWGNTPIATVVDGCDLVWGLRR
ncbi:hypothetical protein M0R72_06875 [Candidatus Pacearchaeota archaeon]|jgi:hypothetical protein|nr:hypothetical protein [Candidatus Pacearchaeota archaeon]